MDKHFFDTVRPMFRGLKQHQVEGCERIIEYGAERGMSRLHLAYVLATTYHETAKWMQPIREGARRFGPSYSDASAQRAVASIYAKGIIRTNYALPTGPYNKSYYGRGLVQITWYDNYKKFGIAQDPDKALEWPIALRIMFDGMEKGMFTGKKLSMIKSTDDFYEARAIVNGDKHKNGAQIAREAVVFYNALANYSPEVDEQPIKQEQLTQGEENERSISTKRSYAPRWWPFRSN